MPLATLLTMHPPSRPTPTHPPTRSALNKMIGFISAKSASSNGSSSSVASQDAATASTDVVAA